MQFTNRTTVVEMPILHKQFQNIQWETKPGVGTNSLIGTRVSCEHGNYNIWKKSNRRQILIGLQIIKTPSPMNKPWNSAICSKVPSQCSYIIPDTQATHAWYTQPEPKPRLGFSC